MALIKVDPSQTKTAVALVGVLAVAIGVTVVRLKPQAATQAAAGAQQGQAQSAPPRITLDRAPSRLRNPFERPANLPAPPADDDDMLSAGPRPESFRADRGPWTPGGYATIEPLGPAPVPGFKATQKPARKQAPADPDLAPASPVFALLATVKSDRGFSAVIRTGQANVRVVEEGDTLEGGFKVISLNDDRAVLTDGRETVVAKRPH
jgi:hypothetical protein